MKKTLFTIDYHEFPNFLNDEDINTLIQTIYKGSLRKYDYFEGRHFTSFGENEADILDHNPDIAKRIEEKCFVKNQRISQSWCTIQGPGSKLKYHKHPESVVSGIIYLKVDDDSSKLVFQNPTSMEGETKEITPTKGLMLMWPSFLMHGSGTTINKSEERIILGFNTYWK